MLRRCRRRPRSMGPGCVFTALAWTLPKMTDVTDCKRWRRALEASPRLSGERDNFAMQHARWRRTWESISGSEWQGYEHACATTGGALRGDGAAVGFHQRFGDCQPQ